MHRAAKTSRFLIDLSSGGGFADSESLTGREDLLHHIVVSRLASAANSHQIFNGLAQELIQLAEHSFGLRDIESLQAASLVLLNLPTAEVRKIGRYYQALAVRRRGKIDESLPLLEAVADSAPLGYRARALQTLGAIHHAKGQLDETLRLYPEARRAASPESGGDLLITLLVSLDIAGIRSETGDHRGALADYEKLSPVVRIVSRENPLYFYFYHNELAVEFAEMGRLAEAEAASAIALASPFAHAYPEWSATRDEIAAKRQSAARSVVAVNRVLEAEPSPQVRPQQETKTSKALIFSWLASDKASSFQRSIIPIPATATTAFNPTSILDRVLTCSGPRAPPTSVN